MLLYTTKPELTEWGLHLWWLGNKNSTLIRGYLSWICTHWSLSHPAACEDLSWGQGAVSHSKNLPGVSATTVKHCTAPVGVNAHLVIQTVGLRAFTPRIWTWKCCWKHLILWVLPAVPPAVLWMSFGLFRKHYNSRDELVLCFQEDQIGNIFNLPRRAVILLSYRI